MGQRVEHRLGSRELSLKSTSCDFMLRMLLKSGESSVSDREGNVTCLIKLIRGLHMGAAQDMVKY